MDLTRVLGALLGEATRPPRRRRRTGFSLGGRSAEARLARALAGFAGTAIEAMTRGGGAAAPAKPAPRRSARLPDWATASAPTTPPGPWVPTAPAPVRPTAPMQPSSPYSPPAAEGRGPAQGPSAEDRETLLLIRTMVAAAKADGAIDAAERRAIAEQLDSAGLDAAERDFVLADFDAPLTPEALARQATDPMLRARLYAGAVVAMGEVIAAERIWLDRLAAALGLDHQAARTIEERLAE